MEGILGITKIRTMVEYLDLWDILFDVEHIKALLINIYGGYLHQVTSELSLPMKLFFQGVTFLGPYERIGKP
jgi:hypothetical protein